MKERDRDRKRERGRELRRNENENSEISDRYQKGRGWRVEDLSDPVQDHPEPALITGIPARFLRSTSWH